MNHKGTVTLETQRLILRRFTMDDLEPIFRNCWSNPEVWKWTNYDPMNSTGDVLTLNNIFTDHWFARYEKADWYSWAIELKETGEAIGRLTGRNPNERIGQIEFAYEIGQNWWGQGLMTEAVKAVIAFFFDEVGVRRIWADHADKNPASGRVMQKCGMRCEGTARQAMVCNAGRFDSVIYAILAEDYFAAGQSTCTAPPADFWAALDALIAASEIVIDRPRGIKHPRFDFVYPLDYGYLKDTVSPDGGGIDVWRGSLDSGCDGVICTVDLLKRDSEIKILLGCTEEEKDIILRFHNDSQLMKGVLIARGSRRL